MKYITNHALYQAFIKSGNLGGIMLFMAVILSLLMANTAITSTVSQILNYKIGIENTSINLNYSLLSWINDGLMTIFFLLVGLEIKREIVKGELSSPQKASLPILCAIGGAIVPAIIYLGFNIDQATSSGWGIPMATDIAFALAVINLLGNRIPSSLKVFLVVLAIVDDLIAILVIAIFYSSGIAITYLAYAALGIIILILMNRINIRNPYLYLIPGIFIWYFIHHSGIHATIAGVLAALTVPAANKHRESPLEQLEHTLVKPVNLLILPIFAFANTNITLDIAMISGLSSVLSLGISLGLLVGKPIGILCVAFICTRLKISHLPAGASWVHIGAVGLLAGIGFTMSIFIALLSFNNPTYIAEAKLTILITSLLAGTIGYCLLYLTTRKTKSSSLT